MSERTTFPIPNSPYRIEKMDDLNWTIFESKITKEGDNAGKERAVAISHHATLEQALNAMARRITDADTHADIESYIEQLREVSQILKGVAA